MKRHPVQPAQKDFAFDSEPLALVPESGTDFERIQGARRQSEADQTTADRRQRELPDVPRKAVCVIFDGPQADTNHEGDEVPAWVVMVADEAGDECGPVEIHHHYESARAAAVKMARDRRLELVEGASRA